MTPTADRRGGSPCVTRRKAGFCCLPLTHGAAGETARRRHDKRVGTGGALVEPRVDRGPPLDLAPHLDCAVRNRGRNRRATDLRRRRWLCRARDRRVLDQIPLRRRRDRADVPCRRGARSGGVQAQMEGGGRGRPRQLLLSVSRVRGGRPLRARMGGDAELARGRCDVHHVCGRGLRGDAGIRLQHDRIRQDRARGLLRHRPWNRARARPHLRAVHAEDGGLRGGRRRGIRGAALADTALLPPLWQSPFGTGGEIPAALPVGIGSTRHLGRQRGGASRLCHRHGAGGNGRQGSRAHSPPAHADLRTAHPVLRHRAGSFVSVPDLVAAPAAFVFMLVVKVFSKIVGVYPVTKVYKAPNKEAMYTTLLMSTGLTFGTISALFGLSRGFIDQGQYSALVAAVIASAVIPTILANAFYLPRHLLPEPGPETKPTTDAQAPQLRRASGKAE